MEKFKFAVIGCGSRGKTVIGNFLKAAAGKAEVAVVYDINEESIALAKEYWKTENFVCAKSLQEAVNFPGADMVCIFTPNSCHCEAILAALAAGKRVFSEKPLATNLADCERIVEAEKRAGISIMTGFVLRYAPIYRKVKELLADGSFGKIINVAASENRHSFGGGASMSSSQGWRRLRKWGGPYLLEKCSHDLDLLNWYAGSLPERVASFSGRDYFIPEHSAIWDKYDHQTFSKLVPEKYRINPFTSEKDVYDNHTVIMEYPGGIKMSFQLTLANAIAERRMYISCTEGTIILECFTGVLRYKRYGDAYETSLKFTGDGHGGGDQVMAQEIMDAVLNGKTLATSGSANGLACARVALAADESVRTGQIVRL